jgi:hypothetical protein
MNSQDPRRKTADYSRLVRQRHASVPDEEGSGDDDRDVGQDVEGGEGDPKCGLIESVTSECASSRSVLRTWLKHCGPGGSHVSGPWHWNAAAKMDAIVARAVKTVR